MVSLVNLYDSDEGRDQEEHRDPSPDIPTPTTSKYSSDEEEDPQMDESEFESSDESTERDTFSSSLSRKKRVMVRKRGAKDLSIKENDPEDDYYDPEDDYLVFRGENDSEGSEESEEKDSEEEEEEGDESEQEQTSEEEEEMTISLINRKLDFSQSESTGAKRAKLYQLKGKEKATLKNAESKSEGNHIAKSPTLLPSPLINLQEPSKNLIEESLHLLPKPFAHRIPLQMIRHSHQGIQNLKQYIEGFDFLLSHIPEKEIEDEAKTHFLVSGLSEPYREIFRGIYPFPPYKEMREKILAWRERNEEFSEMEKKALTVSSRM